MSVRTSPGYKEMAEKRIQVIKTRIRELAKTARPLNKPKRKSRLKSSGDI